MKTRYLLGVLLLAAACGKKADDKKAQPEVAPKVVDKAPPPVAPPARMSVTSKSPEAVAAFTKARDFAANLRGEDALAELKKAVALDPEFALALAELGANTPGAEGTDLLAKAGPLASTLPEAEKAYVEGLQAQRAGDPAKMLERFEKVVELAPGEWEIDLMLANMENGQGDPAAAIKRLEHIQSLKPDLAQAQNALAYAYANQKDWDKAVAAAKKQVELLPKEPNPVDTLGEIQLMAGKLDDADKSFVDATKLDSKFSISWNGAAIARAYKGDFAGAHSALEEQKKSTAPGEKLAAMMDVAWLQLTENKLPDALATLDAIEKEPDAKKFPTYAFAALARANFLSFAAKYGDAAKAYATALSRKDALAGDSRNGLMTGYRLGVLRTAAMQGKPMADADKLIADEETFAKAMPENKNAQSLLAYERGLAAWAKSGPKAAVEELSKCDKAIVGCRHDLALAMRKAGDAAGADAIDKEVAANPQRAMGAAYVATHPSK